MMIRIYTSLLLLIGLTSCLSNAAQNASIAKTIPVAEYKKMVDENKDIQLIDVRTPEEFGEDHLSNAVNINFNGNDFNQKINALDKSKKTMIYCLSGGRSGSALDYMSKNGFKEVYNMQGGILQWRAQNYPLSTASSSSDWKGMTKDEYAKLISGDIPVVIDFNAKWCGPCKQLKPILDQIQAEYAGKIKIIPVDIDENKSLAKSMYVNNIPLLIYHEKGKVILNQEGMLDKEGLVKLFKLSK